MRVKTSLIVLLLCSNFMYGHASFADANRTMVLCNNEPVVIPLDQSDMASADASDWVDFCSFGFSDVRILTKASWDK